MMIEKQLISPSATSFSPHLKLLSDALAQFVSNPPPNTPPDILKVFQDAVQQNKHHLAPSLFFEVVEQAQTAISITDLAGTILYANPAFELITGYSAQKLLGCNESVLSDKSTPSIVYKTLWGRLQQKLPWTGMLVNRRESGERYLAEVTIAPVLNTQGECAYYLGMHRDMTEVYHLEQKVKSQKALIESVVDSAPVMIALLDENYQVILDNQEYKKLISDFRGNEPTKVFLAAIQKELGIERWHDLKLHDGSFVDREVEVEFGRKGLHRWFTCSGNWFKERDTSADAFFELRKQSYFLLVAKEVTELKRQQEEVRMNALRALQAEGEAIENMRETLTGAIHQFQMPINMITAAVGMLERRAQSKGVTDPLADALKEALGTANQAIEYLRQSIPTFNEEPILPTNLNEVLRDVLTLTTRKLLANGVTVDWQPSLVLPPLVGRKARLRSLFKHLIDNAIEAMQDNRHKERELRIRTTIDDTESSLTIVIEDTGSGIPDALKLRIFEPFFTTKSKNNRGAGLGLTTVQEVVNLHSGTIQIDPAYTEGCRFIVQFPITRPKE